jgi:hypothetical protein
MKASLKSMFGRALPLAMLVAVLATVAFAIGTSLSPQFTRSADAAVTNYPPGVAVHAMPIQMGGAYTVSGTVPVRFKLPYAGRLIGFSASARTLSGTISVDFAAGGSSLLSAPVDLTAGTVTEGTVTTSAVADEAELTAVVYITGGSATVSDITILPTFLRR